MPAYRAPSDEYPIADSARPIAERCTSSQKRIAARIKNGSGVGTPAMEPCPQKRKLAGKSVKLSEPPVIAVAKPRKRENDPSVTISGGIRSRVMSSEFNPPQAAPTHNAAPAAVAGEHPPSRQVLPKITAHKPSSEPMDRSIPPVRITGVCASASKPSGTLRRETSKKFPAVKKFFPEIEKIAISAASSRPRIACGERQRADHRDGSPN